MKGYREDRREDIAGLTLAGLLMFGKADSITDAYACPQYFPDYREYFSPDPNDRWTDRIYPDGTWEANLFQFYYRVYPKLAAVLPKPFALKDGVREDETPTHIALREAFINALVHCDYSVGERNYFAIGFRNDYGGWELRSERFKGCSTPKHITTIDNGSDKALAFEGFMDFLSYLTNKQNDSPTCNIAVLNAVANIQKVVPFLARHRSIYTFLDNDDAGRKALAEIERLCPQSKVIDQSDFYRRHKDLNDYLRSQQPRKRVVAKQKRGFKM